jgi:hypothetical protein
VHGWIYNLDDGFIEPVPMWDKRTNWYMRSRHD